jgi:DNA polymerase-3 subunit alpha (Gram-positive type)
MQHGVTLNKDIKEYTKSEASKEIDRILSTFGK